MLARCEYILDNVLMADNVESLDLGCFGCPEAVNCSGTESLESLYKYAKELDVPAVTTITPAKLSYEGI